MEDYINFKIILLGNQGVGKSCLINRYIKGQFSQQYNVTVGVQYASKIVQIDDNITVRLQVWDTVGQQLFRAVVRSFYRGISAVYLLYSIDSAKSFQQLKSWMRQVLQHAHQQVVIFVIGARSDLEDKRQVSREQASVFVKQVNGVFCIQTSSKTGQNIELLFKKAAEILYKKYMVNGSFRNLVRPVLASGSSIQTTQLAASRTTNLPKSQKKSCC